METENKKILLVEDDQNFGAILKDYLMLNDFDVTLAKNGMEGFEKFKKDTYDLCILDVMMPYKDGYTLAKEIREKNGRRILSKRIPNQVRRELREWKLKWTEYVLEKFENTKHLQKIMKAPIQSSACPIDKEAFG